MNTCWNCGKKYKSLDDLDECNRCGAGLVESDDNNFIDFANEYDSDGF